MEHFTQNLALELAADINKHVGQIGDEKLLPERTRKIKDALWKLATVRYGFRPQATHSADAGLVGYQEFCHEFLLDMIWWKLTEDGEPEHVALAAECEMDRGYNKREKDFRKLLALKSPLKVMIVVEQDETETAQFIRELDKVMRAWKAHDANEQYLLFVFAGPKNKAFIAEGERWVFEPIPIPDRPELRIA